MEDEIHSTSSSDSSKSSNSGSKRDSLRNRKADEIEGTELMGKRKRQVTENEKAKRHKSKDKKKRKERKRHKDKKSKKDKKLKKDKKEKSHKIDTKGCSVDASPNIVSQATSSTPANSAPAAPRLCSSEVPSRRPMGPATQATAEKTAAEVTKVYDAELGRYRLVRGDGQIVEQCVSRQEQQRIMHHILGLDINDWYGQPQGYDEADTWYVYLMPLQKIQLGGSHALFF
ncbi:hypothetical protein CYMTET_48066 [Cymbomonas tetramitiformis]|uniref:ADP-ribosylation factor-like protein 6-interacting protein 4 n=1 Tax=Cymbomonas tetramitiformis TaxID=36881 RepID=A0AAE0BUC2_9CHLO|nr:hypothetical protein CYMTET_48066 [Cymbomonas tetramitiformis]